MLSLESGVGYSKGRQLESHAMESDLTAIRNIGPATASALIAAGIPDAATLHRIGAHEAYRALLQSGERPHFIGYYVLCMALQGRPWNDCKGAEKDDLRARVRRAGRRGAAPVPDRAGGRAGCDRAAGARSGGHFPETRVSKLRPLAVRLAKPFQ